TDLPPFIHNPLLQNSGSAARAVVPRAAGSSVRATQLQRNSRAATAIPSTAYPAVTASCSQGRSPPSQPAEIAWLIAPSGVQVAMADTASGITGPGVHIPAKNSIGK